MSDGLVRLPGMATATPGFWFESRWGSKIRPLTRQSGQGPDSFHPLDWTISKKTPKIQRYNVRQRAAAPNPRSSTADEFGACRGDAM
ncbi:hypothetical protein AB0L63_03805 [Nocardia sp. NPDC051990]|uniref:hypothetical protein n=1 Tax=Nocardia sp. NPDC051990 TaxID=3155285 RepID=UPI00342E5E5D